MSVIGLSSCYTSSDPNMSLNMLHIKFLLNICSLGNPSTMIQILCPTLFEVCVSISLLPIWLLAVWNKSGEILPVYTYLAGTGSLLLGIKPLFHLVGLGLKTAPIWILWKDYEFFMEWSPWAFWPILKFLCLYKLNKHLLGILGFFSSIKHVHSNLWVRPPWLPLHPYQSLGTLHTPSFCDSVPHLASINLRTYQSNWA